MTCPFFLGLKLKGEIMKKIFIVILSLICLLSFCACLSGGESSPQKESETTSISDTSETDIESISETDGESESETDSESESETDSEWMEIIDESDNTLPIVPLG